MSDALTPLRHVYGVDPDGAAVAPGGAGHPEQEALRQLKALLDGWPVASPSTQAVAAVEARAAVVTAVLDQTEAAVVRGLSSRPQPRPSEVVLAAVLARAADAAGQPASVPLPAESPVEAAVLDQSLRALDRLPQSRPDASVVAAVLARAAASSAELSAVRSVYLDGPADASAEAAVLGQSRQIVERALSSRPQPRPSAASLDAVLARAAEASGVEAEPTVDVSRVEAAVMGQSLLALDRLPRSRPSAATLDAVRLAAVTVGAAPVGDRAGTACPPGAYRPPGRAPGPAPDSDRCVGRGRHVPGGRAGALGRSAAQCRRRGAGRRGRARVGRGRARGGPGARCAAADVSAPEPEATPTFGPSPLAAAATLPALVPTPQPTARTKAPTATTFASAVPAQKGASRPAAARPAASAPAPPPPSWETSNDVRTLSLRLQELDGEDALAWDDAPAESFGVPSAPSVGSALGIQAVRAGAPARARFRPDSSSVQR